MAERAEVGAAQKLETVDGASEDMRYCEKDPVNVATGTMLFQAVDLELPGLIPLV